MTIYKKKNGWHAPLNVYPDLVDNHKRSKFKLLKLRTWFLTASTLLLITAKLNALSLSLLVNANISK